MTNDYSDRVSRAKENFTGPLNCAQAVAVTFQVLSGLTPEDIENHRHSGGGRAPGGLCGALYAALELLPDAGQRELVSNQFGAIAGSTLCRDIRKAKRVSCAGCVEAAATILAKTLAQNGPDDTRSR